MKNYLRMIEDKSLSLWLHELSKQEFNNIFCLISWEIIDKVLNKEHFNGKICRKCTPKASPRSLFNFGK